MRTFVAITTVLSMLVVGVMAISQQAQEFAPDSNTSAATNTSYNVSRDVISGVLNVGGDGIVWFGVFAIIAVACGLLIAAGSGGR